MNILVCLCMYSYTRKWPITMNIIWFQMNLQIQCQQPLPNLQVTGQSTWQLHTLSCHPWSKRSYRSLLKAQMVRLMCFPLVWHGQELDLHRNLALKRDKNIVNLSGKTCCKSFTCFYPEKVLIGWSNYYLIQTTFYL